MRVSCTAVLAVSLAAAACGSNSRVADDAPAAARLTDWFTEHAAAAGIDFMHFNGMSGAYYFPEVMPPGVGLLDYDNDGDLDLYLVQGQTLGTGAPLRPPAGPLTGRLLRNDLHAGPDGGLVLRFTDVTDASALTAASGYGMGVAAGDIDNDGWTDLYLTYFGRNQMWRNNGNGTFTDVSARSGTDLDGFAVSAAFVDYDRDGWLDLYVGNYLRYSVAADQRCSNLAGVRTYCPPQVYPALPDRLYRNRGNGTFTDVTATALVGASSAAPLASPPRISMAMAGSTSTSPTTAARTSCGPTSATGRSGTRRCSPASPSQPRDRRKRAWGWMPAISTTTATKISS